MIEAILHKSMLQESPSILGVILREVKGHHRLRNTVLEESCGQEYYYGVILSEVKSHPLLA